MSAVIVLVIGLALLLVGGESVVRGASSLGRRLGLTPLVVGLTIVAFGTSAPELAVSVLATRRGETVSRIEIEDHLYGEDNFPMSNAVPAAISTVRAKLSANGGRALIHTRRGLGYVLDEEVP